MSDEVRRRVFDPFYTTKGAAGTGLGLSVSYSIVKRHRGEIRVDSQAGHGASFTIRLPVGHEVKPEALVAAAEERQRQGRILLIDDEPQVLDVLNEMLAEAGHVVTPALSGAEALAAYVPGRFDLVVCNIGMVGMNGWQVAEQLRRIDPSVPVVFVTGGGLTEEDRDRCRGLGIRHCLFKPVTEAELHHTVQNAF